MSLLKFAYQAVIAACFLASSMAFAAEQHFKTPEEAITAYIDAVKKQDFDAVLATTATDHMSTNYDFLAHTDRLKAIVISGDMPTTDPFFISINKAINAGWSAKRIQFLIYSLMTDTALNDAKTVVLSEHPTAATDMYAALRTERLSGLAIAKIGLPHPAQLNGSQAQYSFAREAKMYGADSATERVGLLSFEGRFFLIGFGLIRYGNDWLIEEQASALADTDRLGIVKQITLEEFEALTHD